MSAPSISVIVFARNAGAMIERALKSVCEPPSNEAEVLVLDGGSTDGTLEVVDKYRGAIAYLRSRPDSGPTEAINEGVRHARGEVIALLPADDWLESGALTFIGEQFARDGALDVLTCGARIVRTDVADAGQTWAEYCDEAHLGFTLPNILRNPLTCARFIRKRVYDRLGGMDDSWTFADKEFLVRAYFAKVKSRVHTRLIYNFRRHAGSATNSGRPEMIIRMVQESLRLSRHYGSLPALTRPERTALRRLHAGASARLAVMLGQRAQFSAARATLAGAFRTNPTWPLDALAWYYGSAHEKYRNLRTSLTG